MLVILFFGMEVFDSWNGKNWKTSKFLGSAPSIDILSKMGEICFASVSCHGGSYAPYLLERQSRLVPSDGPFDFACPDGKSSPVLIASYEKGIMSVPLEIGSATVREKIGKFSEYCKGINASASLVATGLHQNDYWACETLQG